MCLQFWATIFTALAAIGACASAIAAYRAVHETNNNSKSQILHLLLLEYTSPDMLDAKRLLYMAKGKNVKILIHKDALTHIPHFGVSDAVQIAVNHFLQIHYMRKLKFIDDDILNIILTPQKLYFFEKYVKPLYEAQDDYQPGWFEELILMQNKAAD